MLGVARAGILSALAATLSLGACAIDDRNVKEHGANDAGSDQGGSGGTSGSSSGGSKATGGTSGSAGKGGSSTGGSAGRGGSSTGGSSTGGSAGRGPTDCNGDPLEVDESVVSACIMQLGCTPYVPSYSLSFCVTDQRLDTFSQDDCGTGVTSCAGYFDCLGVGFMDAPDCTTGDEAYCDAGNNVALTCNRFPYAVDCTKRGGDCATYVDSDDQLVARCLQPSVTGCTDPSDTAQCSGDIAYTCIAGDAYGSDCNALGAECRDGGCFYSLADCSDIGATCETATKMAVCYAPGDLAKFDCAGGLGCVEGDTYTDCVAPGCTTEEPCSESCDGTELTLCYGGVPITVDCADYGFRYCIESTLSNDFPIAYCGIPESAPDRICEVEDTDDDCIGCQKRQCCDEWTTCVDDAGCNDYLDCANACAGESVCVQQCGDSFPAGEAVYRTFYDCRTSLCTSC